MAGVSSCSNTTIVVINIGNFISNKIERVSKTDTFQQIFELLSAKYEGLENQEVPKVFILSCIKNGEDLEIEKNETIETGDLLLSTVKSVKFTLKDVVETMETVPLVEPPRSAFDIMMNKKLQPLTEMKGTDKHTELHNTVVKDVGVILRPGTGQVNGE